MLQVVVESGLYLATGILSGLLIRFIIGRTLLKWVRKTETELDDKIVELLRRNILWFCVMLSAWFAVRSIEALHIHWLSKVETGMFVLIVIGLVLILSRILHYSYDLLSFQHPGLVQTNSLMKGSIYIIVGFGGLMFILHYFGISIAPAIAALGIGGLAIALALQDTLGNLFSGIYIILAKRTRVDDYVRLDSGHEGTITDITWRHTTIRSLNNNLVIVPNIKMAQAIVTNYTVLNPDMLIQIPLQVKYDTDLEQLDRVVIEEVEELKKNLPLLQQDYAPVLRLNPGFGSSALECTLIVGIMKYQDQFEATDAIRRVLVRRFRSEGIRFASPVMQVTIDNS